MVDSIKLSVNDRDYDVEVEEDRLLLHVLRNLLDLKATRFGCGQEQCGACMVLVDDVPVYSCTARVGDCVGKKIETAEIMLVAAGAAPIYAAFLAEQAGQCGYCLSGILMSTKALLDRRADPSREEIVQALDPHLCRCGAHGRIMRAVERAAAMLREQGRA